MKIKVAEIDLANGQFEFQLSEDYHKYRVLIRSSKKPIGWVEFSKGDKKTISSTQLLTIIKKQLGYTIVKEAFESSLIKRDTETIYPGISVVVCTRNRVSHLVNCINTLQKINYPNFEIIIVDNAPSDRQTLELVGQYDLRYVLEKRAGLDFARNTGIAAAKYEIIAFTDDDALVDRAWLQVIAEAFSDPCIMAVTGYVAPAELDTDAQQLFEFGYGGMGHGFKRRILNRKDMADSRLLWASSFGVGANMAFRKKVFDKIGNFDTALDVGTPSHGGGDIDMFHRLVKFNYTLVYEPSMVVWHTHRSTMRALRKQVFDNGRSFGCFLIKCYNVRTVNRGSIIKFFFIDYLLKWNVKNILNSKKIPKNFSFTELYGVLTSPLAYRKSLQYARKMEVTGQSVEHKKTVSEVQEIE